MTLLQVAEVKEILGIESVSVLGLLVAIILALGWYIRYLLKEIKAKDEAIMDYVEKYYVIATKIEETLKNQKNV